MIRALQSVDRDELLYHVLLVFSIAFASLRLFMTVHHTVGQAANLISWLTITMGI